MQAVFFEEGEGGFIFVPEGEVIDAVFLGGEDLGFEVGIVLLGPVVGETTNAKVAEHLRAGVRAAVFRIPAVGDAPCREIFGFKIGRHFGRQVCRGYAE